MGTMGFAKLMPLCTLVLGCAAAPPMTAFHDGANPPLATLAPRVVVDAESVNAEERAVQTSALVDLIGEMPRRYPGVRLIFNQGFGDRLRSTEQNLFSFQTGR